MISFAEKPPAVVQGPWQFSLLELLVATAAIAVVLALHRASGTLLALVATAPHSLVVAAFVARKRRLTHERWSQAWGVLGGLASVPLVLVSLFLARIMLGDGERIGFLPCLGIAVTAWAILRGLMLANLILIVSLLLQLAPRSLPPPKADRLAIIWMTILSLASPI